MAYNFTTIEKKWQQYWLDHKSFAATDPADAGDMPKAYVLDMFPYPSGAGLHVGHPEGYTATDIVSRHLRMKRYNVLHPMGWDAFGLPAEQHAMSTNEHPAINTQKNVDTFRRQIRMLGLSYDWDREVNTTDPKYYRWTQWIFLQLFNSYFDPVDRKAKPIAHLAFELENESLVAAPDGSIHLNPNAQGMSAIAGDVGAPFLKWAVLPADEKRDIINGQRLAYTDEVAVNWCPGLGTVLANEEVIDGRSERGNYPVERRPMRQWLLRITAYADRLLSDLDLLEWPESLKEMQRNWIGKSVGANVEFDVAAPTDPSGNAGLPASAGSDASIEVFTTRPDTLYGATYLVLAPEHPLVDRITVPSQREAIAAYRAEVAAKSERDRMAETKDKTGAFTGTYAINPVNGEKVPIWVADYVLMGYGTGAIMAVPAHDERDFEFARKFKLPIRAVVQPTDEWLRQNRELLRKTILDRYGGRTRDPRGMVHVATVEAGGVTSEEHLTPEQYASMLPALLGTEKMVPQKSESWETFASRLAEFLGNNYAVVAGQWPSAFAGDGVAINSGPLNGLTTSAAKEKIIAQLEADGSGSRAVTYKLRDWLFSRQRYWGEPFPILLDAQQNPYAVTEADLPVSLPPMADFRPTGTPEPPLSKAKEWLRVQTDAGVFTRETNTMPQWAGSCWYYLRYIDPNNDQRFVDPEKEKYWMPVDLYVGGVEHAVLHLLYARFWHKVLFDLGHVSSPEPFRRLVNQGMILGEMEFHVFEDDNSLQVSTTELRDVTDEATEAGVQMIATHKNTGQKLIGRRVTEELVDKAGDSYRLRSDPSIRVDARNFKMSKSRGNVLNPDPIVNDYGADTFRLYEMYMGPLEAQKPWNTRDIIGMSRFLNAVWRNLVGDEEKGRTAIIDAGPIPDTLDRQLHRATKKVGEDIVALRFNTAIAELIKLNNEMTGMKTVPRALAENFVLLLAPFAPHIAEEIWQRLGKPHSLARHPWPAYDEAKLVETTIELPVQVNGKLRGKLIVTPDAPKESILAAARAVESVRTWMDGKAIKKEIYVPGKLVSFVVG